MRNALGTMLVVMLAAVACAPEEAEPQTESMPSTTGPAPTESPSPAPTPSSTPEAEATVAPPSQPDAGPTAADAGTTPPNPAPTSKNHLYVATTGSDSNPGTQKAPFRTINKGANAAGPDTAVHVAPGTYAETIKSTKSGTANGRIRIVSDVTWGAKIVQPPNSKSDTAWDNRGAYVDIEGFEVDGSSYQGGTGWRMGIYSAGANSTIKGNKVHHIASNKNVYTCTSGGGAAVEGDSWYGASNIDVIGNVVYEIGYAGCRFVQGIYQTAPGKVMNNVVARGGEACIHLWHDANHIDIVNNTAVACPYGILVGGGDYVHTKGPADYVNVMNNIVYDNKVGIDEQGQTGTHNVYANNLLFKNGTNWGLQNGLVGTNTITADPLFVSYATSGGDYRLKAGSPAINKGSAGKAPAVDLVGYSRTQSGAPDIGAYEWHP